MAQIYKYITFIILFVILITPFFFMEKWGDLLLLFTEGGYAISSVVYIILLIVSVVVAPFSMPLFFIAGGIWGVWVAAIYNVIGWSIGAAVAFWLARQFGKSFLSRFVSLKKIESYEQKIPKNLEFLGIVLLRMVIPVDILSYALGFLSTISFSRYMSATVIGVTPFAIVFAYGGNALFDGKYFISMALAVIALVSFSIGVYIFNKR